MNSKKVWGAKRVLASSIVPVFPSADPENREKVLEIMYEMFPHPFIHRQSRPSKKELEKKGTNTKDKEITPKQSSKKPKRILCGINEVTRALERREVALVIVCRDVNPALLVAHLPVLCFSTNTKLVVMPGDGTDLGAVIGSHRLLVFGIAKDKGEMTDDVVVGEGNLFADKLIERLTPLAAKLEFPWLSANSNPDSVPPFPKPLTVPHRKKKDMP